MRQCFLSIIMNKFDNLIKPLILLLFSTKAYSQLSDFQMCNVASVAIGFDKNSVEYID